MSNRARRNFRWFVREDLRRWPRENPIDGSGWRLETDQNNPWRVTYEKIRRLGGRIPDDL